MQLPFLGEKSGTIALVLWVLQQAGWLSSRLADEMVLNLEILKLYTG